MTTTSAAYLRAACVCLCLATPGEAFSLLPSRGSLPAPTMMMSPIQEEGDSHHPGGNRHVSPSSWHEVPRSAARWVGAAALGASLAVSALASVPPPALAESPRVVGQLQGSGLVFKDTLQIESFDDPKVQGVTLYISNFQRPITERLTSNFLQDPSYASVVRSTER